MAESGIAALSPRATFEGAAMNERKTNGWNPLGSRDGAGSVTVLAVSVLIVLYGVIGAAGPVVLP